MIIVVSLLGLLIYLFLPIAAYSQLLDTSRAANSVNNKVVVINFDDGYKSQFTNAKPILDKYGFKAAFFVVCGFVGKDAQQMSLPHIVDFSGKGIGQMGWEDLKILQKEGNIIGAHTMNHIDLDSLSTRELDYEIGQSKQCLVDHGIDTNIFAYPYNSGKDNTTVINTVAKYYEMARSGNEPLMFLHCDRSDDESRQVDCSTFSKDGTPNPLSKFSIVGWSHDYLRREYSYDDSQMLKEFIKIVNSQLQYNKNGETNAIPIIIYHRIDNSGADYSTSISLFDEEMKYLHDNGFEVLSIADIGYDENNNYLYIINR
jgi:peptidoglycan/xylan/chitin deacetylase (PgdA/CDA1 family)